MQKGDPDGFLARMSIVTPRLVSFDYDDFTVLEDAVQVEEILRTVRTHHTTPKLTYTFSKEALVLFKEYYKEMKADTDSRDQFIEPEARSILNKMMVGGLLKHSHGFRSRRNMYAVWGISAILLDVSSKEDYAECFCVDLSYCKESLRLVTMVA